MYIALNPRWRVKVMDAGQYILFKHRSDNVWDIHERLKGPRRILLRAIARNGIVLTREAEHEVNKLPESPGFRPDPVEEEGA